MGAMLSGMEVIAMGGAIWNQAQTKVLQNQIRQLWDKHKNQITAVTTLYQLVDKMSFNDSLFEQLNTSLSYAFQNWKIIAKEMQEQSNLIETISTDFTNCLANIQSITEGSNLGIGLAIFGFTLSTLMFWKDVAPQQYQKIKSNLKQAGKTIVDKVKLSGKKLTFSSINEDGRVVKEQVPPKKLEGRRVTAEADNPKNKGRWSKGTLAMNFIRVGFLCFMIYSFIQGRKQISSLRSQLQKDKEYFSDKGKFYQQLDNCIIATRIFSCDVANLGQASRAVIEELHALYLTKAFLQGSSTSHSASRADQLTTEKFHLTDAFIEKTLRLVDNIEAADKNIKTHEEKLLKFVQSFEQFYSVSDKLPPPNQIFLGVTTQISSVTGQDSVINQDLYQKQSNLFSVADVVASEFKQERKSDIIYKKKSNEQKMKIDSKILSVCEEVYKEIIIEDTDTNLRPNEQEILAGIILNYCDEFHGTDLEGVNIYHLNIKDCKSKYTYEQILNQHQHESQAQNIPVHYDNAEKEQKEVDKMLNIAQKVAKAGGEPQFADVADLENNHPKILGRYLNLVYVKSEYQEEEEEEQIGVPKVTLVGSNGLRFKIRGDTYAVQQQIISGKETLVKAGAV